MAMSDGLNVIIVDDNKEVCQLVFEIIKRFYTWGEVISFTDVEEAIVYCKSQRTGVSIFVVDVFLNEYTGFQFLDAIASKYPMVYEDAIMMSGNASDDVVNMCVASNITYLLEKPVKTYALQLAVRAIVNKYINFAKRLIDNPDLAEDIYNF
jgi:DNA-binding NtrC family response regulator